MALQKPAYQSTTYSTMVAANAVDGSEATVSCTETTEMDPWLALDLSEPMDVGCVCVINDAHTSDG